MEENQEQAPKEEEPSAPEEQTPQKPEAKPQIETPTPSFVKARKRKAIIWSIVGVGAAGVLTMGIISFLGHNFGSFTVHLDRDPDVSLEMGTVLRDTGRGTGFQNASTFLSATGVVSNATIPADSLPSPDILDSDITIDNYDDVMSKKKQAAAKVAQVGNADSAGNQEGVYFNYTFYLRNISTEEVAYSIKMAATAVTEPSNLYDAEGNVVSGPLEKFVRIRVYENLCLGDGNINHSQATYAYPSSKSSATGTPLPEYVSDPASANPENRAVCTNFADCSSTLFTVFDFSDRKLPGEALIRYSIVMWFEGFDPDTDGVQTPADGSLAFGVDILGKKSRSSDASSLSE